MELSTEELKRYARHVMLPEVGLEGQKRIRATRVVCIGAGGLGSPVSLYLAAAGIGRLGIVDFDVVDLSNLQRQVVHGTKAIGNAKTQSARETISNLNPGVEVVCHESRITSQNAMEILGGYDIVVDGTDNFVTRYLVNDACVLLKKPNVYGAVFRFDGQAGVLAPHLGGPCYRCLFPEPPPPGTVPSCAEGGVLGVLPGIIGMVQATETLKLALGIGRSLVGRLVLLDALEMKFNEIRVRRDPECPLCGEHPTITKLVDYEQLCGVHTNNDMHPDEVTVYDMKKALVEPELGINVIDVREPQEYEIAHVAGVSLIPLGELPNRLDELNPEKPYYIHCKMGGRSMQAVQFLKQHGFKRVKSVRGGIDAWAEQIDPKVPRY